MAVQGIFGLGVYKEKALGLEEMEADEMGIRVERVKSNQSKAKKHIQVSCKNVYVTIHVFIFLGTDRLPRCSGSSISVSSFFLMSRLCLQARF